MSHNEPYEMVQYGIYVYCRRSQRLNQWLRIVNWAHTKQICDISTKIQIFFIQNIELNGTHIVKVYTIYKFYTASQTVL